MHIANPEDKPTLPVKSAAPKTEDKAVLASAPMPTKKESFRETSDVAGKSSYRSQSSESGLKAGYTDDNDQFNYFIKFLEQYKPEVSSYPLNIDARIILNFRNSSGKPVNNAEITVKADAKIISSGKTYYRRWLSLRLAGGKTDRRTVNHEKYRR